VKANGYLNSDVNKRVFRDDADYSLLISLEKNFDKGVSAEQAKKHGLAARKPRGEGRHLRQARPLPDAADHHRATPRRRCSRA
jgi:hypothetical protein